LALKGSWCCIYLTHYTAGSPVFSEIQGKTLPQIWFKQNALPLSQPAQIGLYWALWTTTLHKTPNLDFQNSSVMKEEMCFMWLRVHAKSPLPVTILCHWQKTECHLISGFLHPC
jgi:hypothetical protein